MTTKLFDTWQGIFGSIPDLFLSSLPLGRSIHSCLDVLDVWTFWKLLGDNSSCCPCRCSFEAGCALTRYIVLLWHVTLWCFKRMGDHGPWGVFVGITSLKCDYSFQVPYLWSSPRWHAQTPLEFKPVFSLRFFVWLCRSPICTLMFTMRKSWNHDALPRDLSGSVLLSSHFRVGILMSWNIKIPTYLDCFSSQTKTLNNQGAFFHQFKGVIAPINGLKYMCNSGYNLYIWNYTPYK